MWQESTMRKITSSARNRQIVAFAHYRLQARRGCKWRRKFGLDQTIEMLAQSAARTELAPALKVIRQ
jgi:hypothetical protein